LYCTIAITAERAMNTRIRMRMTDSWRLSFILSQNFGLIKSKVSVELAVSTSDESVDMEADSTRMTTRLMSSGENEENIVGMIES
jgi:hypothetical protein